ncbi:hypothetical protein METHB2_130021 [Candidatus Methylobacter favarea]|uniref:Uncharacterized protein n=1 Tax=Candidatus Methylobacter favarea TaxID=2707345 RepID=A0A8S0Y982_9GAMM|nr:hypothetical protein METHB2_130021 [Candidatus Methylobacter favarea]
MFINQVENLGEIYETGTGTFYHQDSSVWLIARLPMRR